MASPPAFPLPRQPLRCFAQQILARLWVHGSAQGTEEACESAALIARGGVTEKRELLVPQGDYQPLVLLHTSSSSFQGQFSTWRGAKKEKMAEQGGVGSWAQRVRTRRVVAVATTFSASILALRPFQCTSRPKGASQISV